MDRMEKQETIAALRQVFETSTLVVVSHYSGLTVAQATDLRRKMRDASAEFKVTKNTLAKRAAAGTPYEGIEDLFKGPTGIAFSKDPVAAAKVAADYAKTNDKFIIVGGALGTQALTAEAVQALAKLPSLNELRGSLVGLIQTPATRIAGVVQAPAAQLARVFNAYATKDAA